MSYEIVKSISRKKDNRIFITSASNNWWPREYYKWEYLKDGKYDKELTDNRDMCLFHDIIGGNLQLSCSVSEKWRYAENKFHEYCKNNNINSYDIWNLPYQEGNTIEVLKPYYDIFKKFLEEKDKKGKFYLMSNLGCITKVNNKSFSYTYRIDLNKCKDYKKVYNDYCKLSEDIIDKYNIRIEEYRLVKDKDDVEIGNMELEI